MRIKESDWKTFRRLKPALLDRLCERILRECAEVMADDQKSPHERYLALFKLIHERDDDVAICFDDPRRSNALLKLIALNVRGVFEPDELHQFSEETRADILSSSKPLDED